MTLTDPLRVDSWSYRQDICGEHHLLGTFGHMPTLNDLVTLILLLDPDLLKSQIGKDVFHLAG